MKTILRLMMALSLMAAGMASAALISYDGANYTPVGALEGLNGHASQWASAWSGTNAVIAGSLAYTNTTILQTEGNAFKIVGTAGGTWLESYRTLQTNGFESVTTNIGSATYFGKGGAIVWLSFLARNDGADAQEMAGLGLYEDTSRSVFVGIRWASSQWGAIVEPNFGGNSGVSSLNTETVFFVVQLQTRPNDQPTWDSWAKVWVNPSLTAFDENAGWNMQTYGSGGRQLRFNRVCLQGTKQMTIDELRLGTTAADVMPTIPEPAAGLLLALPALLRYCRRTR